MPKEGNLGGWCELVNTSLGIRRGETWLLSPWEINGTHGSDLIGVQGPQMWGADEGRKLLLERCPLGWLSIWGCILRGPALSKLSISEHDEKVKVRTSGPLHPVVVCGVWVWWFLCTLSHTHPKAWCLTPGPGWGLGLSQPTATPTVGQATSYYRLPKREKVPSRRSKWTRCIWLICFMCIFQDITWGTITLFLVKCPDK